jgi:serine/threonine protein phosphatase PrpC
LYYNHILYGDSFVAVGVEWISLAVDAAQLKETVRKLKETGMSSPEHGIRLRSNARTNTGRIRENNEDNVLLWARDHFVLGIVADGMGGAAAGEEASRIAVETIYKKLVELNIERETDDIDGLLENLAEYLPKIIQEANDRIVQYSVQYPELKGMGTTVTLVIIHDDHAIIGHVGDSRAYLIDGQQHTISQITSDHSFVEAMVMAGHITREEAVDHPMRNVLYRALGQATELDVDIYHTFLRPGDRLVLCTDGLTLHVNPEEIADIAQSDSRPEITTQKLVELANERGGRDNVSVVVINVENGLEENANPAKQVTWDGDTKKLKGLEAKAETPPKVVDGGSDGLSNRLNNLVSSSIPLEGVYRAEDLSREGRDVVCPDQ